MINEQNWSELGQEFLNGEPFNHIVIDNFFKADVAEAILQEFPDYDDDAVWKGDWNNAVEHKRLHNDWDKFGMVTYQAFSYLLSADWISKLSQIVGRDDLVNDFGLHGGGIHAHTRDGHLNVHMDYSVHPKMKLRRNYNIIIYMTPDWSISWGGGLGLWSHDPATEQPKECIKTVDNVYNRAVLFDTTQNSWHGLPDKLTCPENTVRRSLAAYYLTPDIAGVDPRGKALFAPYKDQVNDPAVLDLIKRRADVNAVKELYKK